MMWDPRSSYFPADMQRTYTIYRRGKTNRNYVPVGTYMGQRASLQGNATYGEVGISDVAEERVNLPMDCDVAADDNLVCVEDGQGWSVKFVRRQSTFRVAYLQRSSLATGNTVAPG